MSLNGYVIDSAGLENLVDKKGEFAASRVLPHSNPIKYSRAHLSEAPHEEEKTRPDKDQNSGWEWRNWWSSGIDINPPTYIRPEQPKVRLPRMLKDIKKGKVWLDKKVDKWKIKIEASWQKPLNE